MSDSPEERFTEEKLRELAQRVMERFYIPDIELLNTFAAASGLLAPPFKEAAEVFQNNLVSISRAASIPYAMVAIAISRRQFDSFHVAERIRALKNVVPNADLPPALAQKAYKIASAKIQQFHESEEGKINFRDAILTDLDVYQRDEFLAAAHELLSNTLVMTWGTFEAFITDVLRLLLNSHAPTATSILTHESTKKHFSNRLTIDVLERFEFNIARSLGTLLLSDNKLDSLTVMKDVLSVIFPNHEGLRSKLSDPKLWLLWQRRHLFVHKRGLVDMTYLSKTSDSIPLGSRLQITGIDVQNNFELIRDTAIEFIDAIKSWQTNVKLEA